MTEKDVEEGIKKRWTRSQHFSGEDERHGIT
jgi:hypothetical protein